MKKCDFCTESSPEGKCCWSSQACRKGYCAKAIKKLERAIGTGRKVRNGSR